MEPCARCGKQLNFNEERQVFWNHQLKEGYIKAGRIMPFKCKERKEFPQLKGKKICNICFLEIYEGNRPVINTPETKIAEGKNTQGSVSKPANAPVQIILDFSSLKDVMAKGGVVMTTYKCPNCNGTVKIPEADKVLVCEYCGTQIKPVDIFEKLKALIQP